MKRAVEIYERLVRAHPDDSRALQQLGVALGHLGALEIAAGDRVAAAAVLRRSVGSLRDRLARDDTPQARHELAAGLFLLVRVERGEAARAGIAEGLAVIEPLRAIAADNPEFAEMIAEADRLAAPSPR
jgi:hypothetical protein